MFKISKKIMLSGAVGNALEMYDYAIWGTFSAYLTKAFLPEGANISDMFFLFLVTYILRPLGSFVFGILSDQLGRKKILTCSIFMMGICTTLVAIIPSYQYIGIASTCLLLLSRLIQVLAVGGEYISSIALLIESCEKNKRGYFGSWAAFGVNFGLLTASFMGAIIFYAMKTNLLPDYGWRLAFILSFITMFVGLWIRRSIPESFQFIVANSRREQRPFLDIVDEAWTTFIRTPTKAFVIFTIVWFGVTTTILIFVYAPIHMINVNHLINYQSMVINAISLTLVVILTPVFGLLSDKYGRLKMLSIAIISMLLLIVPYYQCISTAHVYALLLAHVIIGVPCACIFSIIPVLIVEIVPLAVRCSLTGLLYAIAVCFGGGITPLLAIALGHGEYANYAPACLLLLPGVLSLYALSKLSSQTQKIAHTLTIVPTVQS